MSRAAVLGLLLFVPACSTESGGDSLGLTATPEAGAHEASTAVESGSVPDVGVSQATDVFVGLPDGTDSGASNTEPDGASDGAADAGVALAGFRYEMPCGADAEDMGRVCFNLPPSGTCPNGGYTFVDKTVTFAGTPGSTYSVALRIHGIVEPREYSGGTDTGDHFAIGGTPSGDTGFATYGLTTSSPAATYYLNRNAEVGHWVMPVDASKTIEIEGGATIRFSANDPNCLAAANCDRSANPYPCKPYPTPEIVPNPYDGQFLIVDVVSITLKN